MRRNHDFGRARCNWAMRSVRVITAGAAVVISVQSIAQTFANAGTPPFDDGDGGEQQVKVSPDFAVVEFVG